MVYGLITNIRNWLFDRQIIKSHDLGVPIISVGNITVGGTGKTPLVAYISEFFADSGEKVCILTRGYGRRNSKRRIVVSDGDKIIEDARMTGDEPLELARKLGSKAVIVADAKRREAGIWAREKFSTTVFVLDDAFQHRRLRRALDLICVDAVNPFGNKKVLPFGILREPLNNLSRADAIIITRANLIDEIKLVALEDEVSNLTDAPIFISRNEIKRFIDLKTNREIRIDDRRAFAFCALGNPENFFSQLRIEKIDVAGEEAFPDHHFYNQKDVEKLEQKAMRQNADVLITTAKDAVKLKNLNFEMPCLVAENRLVFEQEKKLHDLLDAVFSNE